MELIHQKSEELWRGPSVAIAALSVPRGKFLPTDHHGSSGGQRVTRSLRTFTLRHVHALEIPTRVEEQGNCGYTQLNLHSYRNSMTRLQSGGNNDQITVTSEEVLESDDEPLPTMEDIQEVAKEQGLKVEVRSLGPWFQINLMNADETVTMGSAEGFETRWTEGKILHLEAIRLTRAAKSSSMLGPGFLVGAAAMRYGLDKNCPKAELLAINDDNETHARLVKYYSRMGFKAMYELTEESWGDILDRVVWGGIGTRMDANCEELLRKWAKLLKPKSKQTSLNPVEDSPQIQKLGENQQYQ
ncbi:hypothetical protein R1sor_008148 [Riccia sorocarpa]|uniref:N-acetyltransferase domain-containing protein n=1 Tax=Riccia sorocarpa TaxID=122646 RepID=A0ABD3HW12_9MARC